MQTGSVDYETGRAPSARRAMAAMLVLGIWLGDASLNVADAHAPEPVTLPLASISLRSLQGARLPSAHPTARDVLATIGAEPGAPEPKRAEPLYGASPTRTVLMEMPSTDFAPGHFSRPKYALGFRSESMKGFAQGLGLDADTCLLPLVRARVSLSRDAGAGGRLMVFARCTFH